jgi:hypothetical protein
LERPLLSPHALQQLLRVLGDISAAAMTGAQAQDLSAAAMLACKLRDRLPHEGSRRSPDLPADRLEPAVITFIEIDRGLPYSHMARIYGVLSQSQAESGELVLPLLPSDVVLEESTSIGQ